jgi:replicative DNA helicase Mcm
MEDSIEKFVQFFRKTYYNDLLSVAREYPDKKSVLVDYAILDKFDTELADALLNDPSETLKIAKDAISDLDLGVEGEYDINVRVFNTPKSRAVSIRNLRSEEIDKLISIDGIVKSASDVRPEATRAIFQCPDCQKEIIVPQYGKTMQLPYACDNPTCGRRGKFSLKRVDLVNAQRIGIQEPPEEITGGEQPSSLYIHLTEDLVTPLERKKATPGNRVKVYGTLRKSPIITRQGTQTNRFDLYMDANYIETIEKEYEEIKLSDDDVKLVKKLSKEKNIFTKLTSSIAPSIFGYDMIKEAILLQLFGGVNKTHEDGTKLRGNIHVFLVGDPGVAKSQLLWYVSRIAPKGRFVSGKKASGVGLTAAVVRDEFSGGWMLEAGALILANNGIASVDEFDKMDSDDRSAMLEAMEQGTISIAKAGIVTTLRASTSVLAAANPKFGRFDRYKLLAEQINLSPVILSRFDLMFPIQDIPSKERDERLSDHVLGTIRNPKGIKPDVDEKTMKKYIAYAKTKVNPKLTKEAVSIIKNFYVSWRSKYVGDTGDTTVPLTPRQLEALVRIAEASAKVRLDDKVREEDAQRAIRLLEYSLREISTEPETGKIDIDRISSETSSIQRSRIHTVISIIDDLMEDVGKAVPIEDILINAKERGIDERAAAELIKKLKEKGDLYEPKQGFLQKS